MTLAGLTAAPCKLVKPPRVKESPVAFECEYHQTIELPGGGRDGVWYIVLGRVLGIHIDDEVIADGMVDVTRLRPIARLGYDDYSVVDSVFSMQRPK
jgi:flavin reductase (DIM6/NTAB) family NADH-FMN oxidoreductase RutF